MNTEGSFTTSDQRDDAPEHDQPQQPADQPETTEQQGEGPREVDPEQAREDELSPGRGGFGDPAAD